MIGPREGYPERTVIGGGGGMRILRKKKKNEAFWKE